MSSVDRLAKIIGQTASATTRMNTGLQSQAATVVDGSVDFVSVVDTGEVDEDGDPIMEERVTASLGVQEDGSVTLVTLDGPEPPVPSGVTAVGGIGSLSVTWDGTWVGDAAAYADHDHVAIHVAEKALVDAGTVVMPSNTTVAATIRPTEGGTVVVAGSPHVTYDVCAVAVSTAAKWSAPSTLVEATPTSVLDDTDLVAKIAAKPEFFEQDTAPTGDIPNNSWWLTVTAPQTLKRRIAGEWVVQQFDASQVVAAGTVIAGLLAAGSVTAGTIAAGAITADEIAAGAITAEKLTSGAVSADKIAAGAIDGMVITGPTIRTAASGERVQIDAAGLHGFDSAGVEKTTVGTDGVLHATGAEFAGGTITGSSFHQENSASLRSVDISAGQVELTGADGVTQGTLGLGYKGAWAPEVGPSVSQYELQLVSDRHLKLAAEDGSIAASANSLTADCSTDIDLRRIGDAIPYSGRIATSGTETYLEHDDATGARYFVRADDTGVDTQCVSSGGTILSRIFAAASGNVYLQGTPRLSPGTTTASANAYFAAAAGGYRVLAVSTSLRRHKKRIRDAEVTADHARSLRPRQWFDAGEMRTAGLDRTATAEECLAAGLKWIPGFVAEEVEAVSPLLCTYDEDGALAGVAYDRLAVALCARAEEAESRLAKIEARLAAIEGAVAQ